MTELQHLEKTVFQGCCGGSALELQFIAWWGKGAHFDWVMAQGSSFQCSFFSSGSHKRIYEICTVQLGFKVLYRAHNISKRTLPLEMIMACGYWPQNRTTSTANPVPNGTRTIILVAQWKLGKESLRVKGGEFFSLPPFTCNMYASSQPLVTWCDPWGAGARMHTPGTWRENGRKPLLLMCKAASAGQPLPTGGSSIGLPVRSGCELVHVSHWKGCVRFHPFPSLTRPMPAYDAFTIPLGREVWKTPPPLWGL